jgi:hypothetical protein
MFNKGIAQAEDRTLEMCMEHSSFESALRQNLPKTGDEGKLSQKGRFLRDLRYGEQIASSPRRSSLKAHSRSRYGDSAFFCRRVIASERAGGGLRSQIA